MSYSYRPLYKLIIARVDPISNRITSLRQVTSLQSLNCTLTTATTMGTLTATWADTDFSTFTAPNGATDTRPTPMCLVQLQLTNKQGLWGIAWTGLADSIARTVNMGQSKVYTLSASSPYKLFNITTQTASSSIGLTIDYSYGMKGTALLKFIAKQCNYPGVLGVLPAATGWGYSMDLNGPGAKGTIDYSTDVGVDTYGALSASIYLSPAQQTYSSILQSLVGDTELEFFFNEMGQLVWRPLAYLNIPGNAPTGIAQANLAATLNSIAESTKIIQKDVILNHTFTETDQGALTTIYVRYSVLQNIFTQGIWQAPHAMEVALQPRIMVFYAPWIQDHGSANNLANALGLRYSGNMHTADVIMIADPTITVGTTIRIPKFPDLMPQDNTVAKLPTQLNVQETPWYYYYVYAITYNLQVGGQWTMELDLRYGRDEKLQFPYLNTSPYLQDRQVSTSGLSNTLTIPQFSTDPANPYVMTTPLNYAVNKKVPTGYIVVNPELVIPGTLVIVKDINGNAIGEYTTMAPTDGKNVGYTVQLPPNTIAVGAGHVFLTIEGPGASTFVPQGGPTDPNAGGPGAPTPSPGGPPLPGRWGYAEPAGSFNLTKAGQVMDHVSQFNPFGGANEFCGPASTVRYLRNRTRRGQAGLPIAGDKWTQVVAAAAAMPLGATQGTNMTDLATYIQSFLGKGEQSTFVTDWATVLKWTGAAIVVVGAQPQPPSWSLAQDFPGISFNFGHIILWMKELGSGNVFNDPLSIDHTTGAYADCTYSIPSLEQCFSN